MGAVWESQGVPSRSHVAGRSGSVLGAVSSAAWWRDQLISWASIA